MNERKQERPFSAAHAAKLEDPARFDYLPPQTVLDLLAPPQGARLLDFGAGTGVYALELARLRPDLHVIAYDTQPEMLELARAKPAFAERKLEAALPDDLSALRGTIDRLLSINVLHEIDDVDVIAMRALMATGASGVIVDWDADASGDIGPPRERRHTLGEAMVRLGAYLAVEKTVRLTNQFAIVVRA